MQEGLDLNKTQGASTPEEVKRMQNVPYALAVGSIIGIILLILGGFAWCYTYAYIEDGVTFIAKSSVTFLAKRCAVVTGGNKGIGFEICRQLALTGIEVILTSRNESRGVEAIEKLNSSGLSNVIFHQLDITDSSSVARLTKFIKTHFRKLDILINNAAEIGLIIHEEEFRAGGGFVQVTNERAYLLTNVISEPYQLGEKCLYINYYGTKAVTKALIPLLQLSKSPRIMNVSSTGGDLILLHNEKMREELQDIDKLTEEKIDEIIRLFLKDFKNAKLQKNRWPLTVSTYKVSKIDVNAVGIL
ncbi:glucose/ribitol dehydrogenase [Tanacetum coccineum]